MNKSKILGLLLVAFIGLMGFNELAFAATPPSPVNIFLLLDGIQGGATEKNHEKWIDCISFVNEGVRKSAPCGGTGGGIAAACCLCRFCYHQGGGQSQSVLTTRACWRPTHQ